MCVIYTRNYRDHETGHSSDLMDLHILSPLILVCCVCARVPHYYLTGVTDFIHIYCLRIYYTLMPAEYVHYSFKNMGL